MNKLLVLSGVLLLGACAPGQFMDRHNGTSLKMSEGNFEYIGCHKVDGEKYVMGPFGLDVITTGNRIFFLQKNQDILTKHPLKIWQKNMNILNSEKIIIYNVGVSYYHKNHHNK
jgi:hypothetical protein